MIWQLHVDAACFTDDWKFTIKSIKSIFMVKNEFDKMNMNTMTAAEDRVNPLNSEIGNWNWLGHLCSHTAPLFPVKVQLEREGQKQLKPETGLTLNEFNYRRSTVTTLLSLSLLRRRPANRENKQTKSKTEGERKSRVCPGGGRGRPGRKMFQFLIHPFTRKEERESERGGGV